MIIIQAIVKTGECSPESSPEGVFMPPCSPKHCCCIPPQYCNGNSLEEVFLAAFLPCCLAQALPKVPNEDECCLTKHTRCFHCDEVMAGLQGGVLGTLQMPHLRCQGSCLSSCRGNMWRCVGVWACGVPHKHLPQLPWHYWAPVRALSIGPVKALWFQLWGDLGRS